jgi:WD40-like Beta Propeller Repeat
VRAENCAWQPRWGQVIIFFVVFPPARPLPGLTSCRRVTSGCSAVVWLSALSLSHGCFLRDDFYLDPASSGATVDDGTLDADVVTDGDITSSMSEPTGVIETEGPVITVRPTAAPPDAAAPPWSSPSDAGAAVPVADAGASMGGSACARYSVWGEPDRIDGLGLNGTALRSPSLSGDGLQLFFSATLFGDERIYVARRTLATAEFSPASEVLELTSNGFDGTPAISADGLTIVFSSSRGVFGGGGFGTAVDRNLWLATRATTAAKFEPPRELEELNTPSVEHLPWLAEDGLTLVFASARDNDDDDTSNVWTSTRASSNDPFVTPVSLPGVEQRAAFSSQGRAVYFTAERGEEGSSDIYFATRPDPESDFGTAQSVVTQNTEALEADVTLARDNLQMLYVSDRDGTALLWQAFRTCLD